MPANPEPAELSLIRAVVAELGLGRERVLSAEGRDEAAERWLAGEGGPDNPLSKLAPTSVRPAGSSYACRAASAHCSGSAANAFSVSEGTVVSVDHGCGAHSNVLADERVADLPPRSGTPSSGTHQSRFSTDETRSLAQRSGPGSLAVATGSRGNGAHLRGSLPCDVGHKLVTLSQPVHQTLDSRGVLPTPGESPCRTRHLITGAESLVSRGLR